MKKIKFLGMAAAAVAAIALFAGCSDLTAIEDYYTVPAAESVTVGLGAENTLNVSKVNVNGTVNASLADSDFEPSAWNSLDEFINVTLASGEYVEYTFTQPTQGSNVWNSWSIAVSDGNDHGNFLRADNWLNTSTDAGYSSGYWCAGGSSANGSWSNGYSYDTQGSLLPTDATVVIKVAYDGTDVTITETVDGDLAYTTTSANW